ncbi:oligopeptidase A [Pseudomonas guariconensis]|uniref:M3 family metallopeptidase n=1 Tax=Pseudomonas guariconensis TaxID=1288410 RepID=UPI00088F0799|nr:M3 family metallopeptidase [Pseudomonas guariconensis]SDC75603.1 oligopeptidase A [Pseudomonas guariconensis]
MQARNPLLNDNRAPIDYDSVTLEHVKSALDTVAGAYETGLSQVLEGQQKQPSWDGLVLAMYNVIADLQATVFATLPLANKGEAWHAAFGEGYRRAQRLFMENRRNKPLHALYQRLATDESSLDVYEKATLRRILLEYRLAGVHLDAQQNATLAQLEDDINEQIGGFYQTLDETSERSSIQIEDEARLQGVPQRLRDLMARQAKDAGLEGWQILCNERNAKAILEFADDRRLREAVYTAYHSRGVHSDEQQDNGNRLQQLALLREQKGQLIGNTSYAQLILQGKAAGSVEPVHQLLQTLAQKLRPAMLKARTALQGLAAQHDLDAVQPWDVRYLRARKQAMSNEALRGYFTLDKVVHALVDLAERVFDLTLTPCSVSAWHPSVRSFTVHQEGVEVGMLYLDVLMHPGKQDGAHTIAVRHRRRDEQGRTHGASVMVVSDGEPGLGGEPALLDHLALRKLFHEFGHGLHILLMPATNHLLSDPNRAGSDSQEFFGKFLERWLWNAQYLADISSHYLTGEPLTLAQAQAALANLREAQLEKCVFDVSMALFDLELHSSPGDGKSIQQRLSECRERCGCWPLASFEKPAHAFDYLVAGYEAGYYSYVWGEAHAIDVFTHFEKWGLFDNRAGKRFRAAFANWANAKPMPEGCEEFLGRPMQIEALLDWYGLE